MKKFAFFIKTVMPAIMAVHTVDDNSLYIQYLDKGVTKITAMTLSDYELATGHGKKINGFMDHMNGLS